MGLALTIILTQETANDPKHIYVSLRQTAAVLNQKLGYLSVGFHYKFILTKVP